MIDKFKLVINGGKPLSGSVKIEGAKNSVLKLMAAALLVKQGTVTITNVPDLSDVHAMVEILSLLGSDISFKNHTLVINSENLSSNFVPMDLATKLRASIICFGALTGRFREARVSLPGGCNIGARKLDLHIKGIKALGAEVTDEQGFLFSSATELVGNKIYLDLPSNGATENIMLAAVTARGETIIENAARDPEIVDLANFLNAIGCNIEGAGSSNIKIHGVDIDTLHGCDFDCLPDRIEAATYLIAGVMTRSDITVERVVEEDLQALLSKLEDIGANIQLHEHPENNKYLDIRIDSRDITLKATDVKTMWYPGFSTDIQPIFSALLCICEGTSTVTENIYNSRFQHMFELNKMGADADVNGKVCIIKGAEKLKGSKITGSDLRAASALVVAAIAAEGTSEVYGLKHLDRGYADIEAKFTQLGADVKRQKIQEIEILELETSSN